MTQLALRRLPRRKLVASEPAPLDLFATVFKTALGWTAIAQDDEMLLGVVFGHASLRQATDALKSNLQRTHAAAAVVDLVDAEEQPKSIRRVIAGLERYAVGDDVDFGDVAIDERHLTSFGRRIVQACRRISAGQTQSYGELAAQCGSPGAARAVGQVMAKNRYPLVVPCHRVLAAGGLLGGFSAPQGLAMKRRLLAMESQLRSAR